MTTRQYSSEHAIHTPEQQALWEQVEHGLLPISANVTLAYCQLLQPHTTKAIVISSGRIECYEKYKELIYDLYQQGYSVYCLDHRGQGLSSRLTKNPHMGHVDKFDDYIDDFDAFIERVVKPKQHEKLFCLAHSMGCAIAALYMQFHTQTFTAAVFSAPMFGVNLPLPRGLVDWLAGCLDSLKRPRYILGGRDFRFKPFHNNKLTSSQSRYQAFHNLYRQRPTVQLGSPTNRWLLEALHAADRCWPAIAGMRVPILLLKAEADTIVDNHKIDKYYKSMKHIGLGEMQSFKEAKHELFVENDTIRSQVLDATLNFFEKHHNRPLPMKHQSVL
ncbi:alpha/beta fold hydrolase [Parashewanella curva]|uniref:Alpha/beta fold hydrolase n=1 Tax=Parashewanella curva TaxID=2338552 RepID=A0A3L8PZB3_9GAMM|nr:alpha/beta fold hydrolase [Parashewanella curva]RLV60714.1 alpha/beta fold hydrolase [Parashewanella curva]